MLIVVVVSACGESGGDDGSALIDILLMRCASGALITPANALKGFLWREDVLANPAIFLNARQAIGLYIRDYMQMRRDTCTV